MRKTVQTFPSYEEANDAQITLLAAGIECIVTRRAQGVWDIVEGRSETYGVDVDEEDYDQAKELLERHMVDDYEPLIQCPTCKSTNSKRYSFYDSPAFLFTWVFIIPLFWSMYLMKTQGRRFRCEDCKTLYRIKL